MRETKIVQVYPSDYAIECAIKEWESFGWEMTDNQKFSSKEDLWFPGGTTVRTTTYNKLTFSREKSSPWYAEVKRFEEEYEAVKGQKASIMRKKPVKKELGFLDVLLCVVPVPFFPFVVYQIVKKVKFKKGTKKFENDYNAKLKGLDEKAENIRLKAKSVLDNA